jgi:hypothetical protein
VQPWRFVFTLAAVSVLLATALWEWRMRQLQLLPGDVDDSASAWVEQRRRIDTGEVEVAIIGDSRILFDTDPDRFEALTGLRPVQLALPGTNARPFLVELAADADFRGLAIVGIADTSYFRKEIGLMNDALDRYHFESPAQRSSFELHRLLSLELGFLDRNYRLSTLVHRLDRGVRADVWSPYDDVWKVSTKGDERRTAMWSRIETDADLRNHARSVWMARTPTPVEDEVVAMTVSATREAVASIRARGGEVVFLRPPSSPEIRALEDQRVTRARGWDALLSAADVRGIHFEDDPAMRGLDLPEYSHLSATCATVYTDAYVRALARVTPRLRVRADAPLPLTRVDCPPAS